MANISRIAICLSNLGGCSVTQTVRELSPPATPELWPMALNSGGSLALCNREVYDAARLSGHFHHNQRKRVSFEEVSMRRGVLAFSVLLTATLSGCSSSHQPREIVVKTDAALVAPVDAATRAKVTSLSVSIAQAGAPGEEGFVPGETVGDRLSSYSNSFPFVPGYGKDGWILLPLEGAIYLIGLPFAAATTGPSPEDAEKARASLKPVLADSAWPDKVEAAFVKVMASSIQAPAIVLDPANAPATAQLRFALDGPILSVRGDWGQPVLQVRGMLEQNGACLVDRRWQWNGLAVEYLEMAGNLEALRKQIDGGAEQIGRAIAEDLFLSDEPRAVDFNQGATLHQSRPKMSLWPILYPNTVASWDEGLGKDGRMPCGRKTGAPATPEIIVHSTPKAAPAAKRSAGTHCWNPRQHRAYLSTPNGCFAADQQMTDVEYQAWIGNQVEP